MKIRIVDKSLGMSGNNISFYDEEFFSLKPNESIIQIGNGKNNGTTGSEIFTEAVFSNKDRITGKTTAYLRFFAPNFIRTKK